MTIWMPALKERSGPLYLAVADALAGDVEAGRLVPGTRLPTHRELAERLGVTVGTVSHAYAEAARRGLISGEVGRGTYVRLPPSTLDDVRRIERDRGMVDLSQNHPPPAREDGLGEAVEASLLGLLRRERLEALLDYPADGGNARDREAGARWIETVGIKARPEDVLVCSGAQHGLTTVLATILKPGDLLLTEELTYPGLKAVAGLLHLRLRGVAMDADGVRPEALEQACRSGAARALYVVPTIQNPTGAVMPLARRRRIAEIARAHGLALVEDDVHARLPEQRPPPVAAFAPERSYYLMSTSKMLAPGLRVAYVLTPPGMFDRLAANLRATTWSAPPLMAALASSWIGDGTAEALLRAHRRQAAARQARARRALAGASFMTHPASYFLWLQLPEPWRSDTFAAELRTRGVRVTTAEPFLVGRGAIPHRVRLCLGAPRANEELERALAVVAETIKGGREPGAPVV